MENISELVQYQTVTFSTTHTHPTPIPQLRPRVHLPVQAVVRREAGEAPQRHERLRVLPGGLQLAAVWGGGLVKVVAFRLCK